MSCIPSVPSYTFNVTTFRVQFPQFADPTLFPTATLQMYFDMAGAFVANQNYGWLAGTQRFLALNLMTAHLVALSVLIAGGETPGLVQSATIDKITVSLTPPPVKTALGWWFQLTPYGQQLWALLSLHSVGGFFNGGSATRAGFRGNAGYPGYRC